MGSVQKIREFPFFPGISKKFTQYITVVKERRNNEDTESIIPSSKKSTKSRIRTYYYTVVQYIVEWSKFIGGDDHHLARSTYRCMNLAH